MDNLPKLGAFVTFNQTKQMSKVIKFFHSIIKRNKKKNKLNGKYALKAQQALSPSNILWENLEVKWCESFC